MGYYRKGYFRNGKWVSGHYVSTFGRNTRKSNPQGCVVIVFGGIISILLYFCS